MEPNSITPRVCCAFLARDLNQDLRHEGLDPQHSVTELFTNTTDTAKNSKSIFNTAKRTMPPKYSEYPQVLAKLRSQSRCRIGKTLEIPSEGDSKEGSKRQRVEEKLLFATHSKNGDDKDTPATRILAALPHSPFRVFPYAL